jgi:hypothetical protein
MHCGGDNGGQQTDRGQRPQGRGEEATQLKNPLTKTATKRNKDGGRFMAVKKTARKFKGVRREK